MYKITPTLYRSTGLPYPSPSKISGAVRITKLVTFKPQRAASESQTHTHVCRRANDTRHHFTGLNPVRQTEVAQFEALGFLILEQQVLRLKPHQMLANINGTAERVDYEPSSRGARCFCCASTQRKKLFGGQVEQRPFPCRTRTRRSYQKALHQLHYKKQEHQQGAEQSCRAKSHEQLNHEIEVLVVLVYLL